MFDASTSESVEVGDNYVKIVTFIFLWFKIAILYQLWSQISVSIKTDTKRMFKFLRRGFSARILFLVSIKKNVLFYCI